MIRLSENFHGDCGSEGEFGDFGDLRERGERRWLWVSFDLEKMVFMGI